VKPALAASRTIDVTNYLAMNPRRAFTLSELASATSVSPASLSDVLLALTQAGWLIRHPRHKTFEIGPALVAVGHAAGIRHPVVESARPAMTRLASLGTECVGSALLHDEIIILALEGGPAAPSRDLRVGQRLPLVPPFGHVFLAWDGQDRIERWLAALADPTASFDESLAVVRRRGFAVGLKNEEVATMHSLADEVALHPRDDALRARLRESIVVQLGSYVLDEIDPAMTYDIENVAAPIFDSDGSVAYALTVQGIGQRSGAELLDIGDRLGQECRLLTRQLGGHTGERR